MKVEKLIEELKKCNPEAEVICNGDGPIYFLEPKPGYYDGHTPILIQDDSKSPYYNIIGYKWDASKEKIVLQSMNFEDCLWDADKIDEFIVEGTDYYLQRANGIKTKVKKELKEMENDSKI